MPHMLNLRNIKKLDNMCILKIIIMVNLMNRQKMSTSIEFVKSNVIKIFLSTLTPTLLTPFKGAEAAISVKLNSAKGHVKMQGKIWF